MGEGHLGDGSEFSQFGRRAIGKEQKTAKGNLHRVHQKAKAGIIG